MFSRSLFNQRSWGRSLLFYSINNSISMHLTLSLLVYSTSLFLLARWTRCTFLICFSLSLPPTGFTVVLKGCDVQSTREYAPGNAIAEPILRGGWPQVTTSTAQQIRFRVWSTDCGQFDGTTRSKGEHPRIPWNVWTLRDNQR